MASQVIASVTHDMDYMVLHERTLYGIALLCWCLTSGCLYGMVLHERIVRYCEYGLAGTFSLIVRYCDGIAGG